MHRIQTNSKDMINRNEINATQNATRHKHRCSVKFLSYVNVITRAIIIVYNVELFAVMIASLQR